MVVLRRTSNNTNPYDDPYVPLALTVDVCKWTQIVSLNLKMMSISCDSISSEYLATFKKTVAMHEVFLQRLAAHPQLRNDHNFKVFLEYKQEVGERPREAKPIFCSFISFLIYALFQEVFHSI